MHAIVGRIFTITIEKNGILPNQIYFYLIFHGTVYTYYDI